MMAPMAPDYGQRIRRRRQALGMSQKELAGQLGVSESAVISWEKYRHAPTRKQGAVEAVLGISLDGEPEQVDPDLQAAMELLAQLRKNPVTEKMDFSEVDARIERAQQRGRHARNGGRADLVS